MKVTTIAAVMLLSISQNVQGQVVNPVGEQVVLYGRPHVDNAGIKNPKAPVQPPYVTLDDHTLYIWSQHSGFTLTLIDGSDNVVYQTYLFAGVQYDALPPTLSGSYTLQLSDDTYLYTGMIDLE